MRTRHMVTSAAVVAAMTSTAAFGIPLDTASPSAVEPHIQSQDLNAMVGKKVLGKSLEFLGYITAVDQRKDTAEMKIPTGATVELPANTLVNDGDHVTAPTVSRGDVLAMVQKSGQGNIQEVKTQ